MTTENSTEERIRKTFVRDVKSNEILHTVFKAHTKTLSKGRSGKPFLALVLVDKTGQIDGRVFENVEAADQAFAAGDYLLIKGKSGAFHGKPQIVIDRLERLDPGPIDAAEFAFVPVIEAPKAHAEAPAKHDDKAPRHEEKRDTSHKAARARLLRLLDNPEVVQALDTIVRHLEGAPAADGGIPNRKPRGPRVEHKPHHENARPEKPGPKRDPSLPQGIAFKPFDALVATAAPAASEPSSDNKSES